MSEFADLDLDVTLRGFDAAQKVFGRYTLRSVLGRGGMGVVWLARDESLERDVALKFLPELVVRDQIALGDLKREANRSLALTHPHIVRVFDFIEDEARGIAAISMEYVDGDNLSNLRAAREHRCFEVAELTPWTTQFLDALAYAHGRVKVVHRDLKPANLMLNSGGELKIADFGIARSLVDSVSRVSAATGIGSGTLAYMSPQQAAGHRSTIADDIYAIGATLYDLLTGRPPFYTGSLYEQVRDTLPPSLAARREELEVAGAPIPREWEETIAACLAKDPAQRPASVHEIARRLGLPVPAGKEAAASSATAKPVVRIEKPAPPNRGPVLKIAALLLVLTLAAAGGWWFGLEAPRQQREKDAAAEQARIDAEQKSRAAADAAASKLVEEQRQVEARRLAEESAKAAEAKRLADEAAKAKEAEAARMAAEKRAAEVAAEEAKKPKRLVVPDQFPTIQAAIDAAKAGDTVAIKPGTYREALFLKSGVSLAGTDMETCRVEVPDNAFYALAAAGCSGSIISNLTFDGRHKKDLRAYTLDLEWDEKDGRAIVTKVKDKDLAAAGLTTGAILKSVNGIDGRYWAVVLSQAAAPQDVKMTIEENGATRDITVRSKLSAQGSGATAFVILDSELQVTFCASINSFDGIDVAGAKSKVLVSDCEVRQNEMHGISIYAGSVEVERTRCQKNAGDGLFALGKEAHLTARDNTCSGNGNGISLLSGADGTLERNHCERNTGDGIDTMALSAPPSHAVIKNNICNDNGSHGINISDGASPTVTENECANNKHSGIFVWGKDCAPKISDNRLLGNSKYGLCIHYQAKEVVLGKNSVSGNKLAQINRDWH